MNIRKKIKEQSCSNEQCKSGLDLMFYDNNKIYCLDCALEISMKNELIKTKDGITPDQYLKKIKLDN